jgi:hypothetical protein
LIVCAWLVKAAKTNNKKLIIEVEKIEIRMNKIE